MPAPIEIIDNFESVLDIFFSGVRHRERAAFILCDNLFEMTCKTKARQYNHTFNTRCHFHDAINAPGVRLPKFLKDQMERYRDQRNTMQHASAASTVDAQYCADAILCAENVLDRCWGNTTERRFRPWMKTALRIVRLYSSDGDASLRQPFEDYLRSYNWRGNQREGVQANSVQIEIGVRQYWWFILRNMTPYVEECLNGLEIP